MTSTKWYKNKVAGASFYVLLDLQLLLTTWAPYIYSDVGCKALGSDAFAYNCCELVKKARTKQVAGSAAIADQAFSVDETKEALRLSIIGSREALTSPSRCA